MNTNYYYLLTIINRNNLSHVFNINTNLIAEPNCKTEEDCKLE